MVYTLVCHAQTKPDATSIEKFKRKLIEASRVYRHDKETIDWHVMQDVHDQTKFTIVERFEHESSQKYHLENPYWAGFNPYVEPLLAKPIEILRHEELDTSKDVELLK